MQCVNSVFNCIYICVYIYIICVLYVCNTVFSEASSDFFRPSDDQSWPTARNGGGQFNQQHVFLLKIHSNNCIGTWWNMCIDRFNSSRFFEMTGLTGFFQDVRHCFLTIVHAYKVMLLQAEMSGKNVSKQFLSSSKTHQSWFLKPLALNTLGFLWVCDLWDENGWNDFIGTRMKDITVGAVSSVKGIDKLLHIFRLSVLYLHESYILVFLHLVHFFIANLVTLLCLMLPLMLCWSNECTSLKE